uniref:Cnidarian restricted protein n=1 Tax=Clytia hemisphaerica TaxID=252671 RepID=A0A7M5XDC4_9CNID
MKYNIAFILLVKSMLHFCQGYSQQLASISFDRIKGSIFYGLDRFKGEYSAEYCLSKNAVCDRLFSGTCSWCICKDMMTFVSYRDGCKDRRDADVILGVSGQMCFGVQNNQQVYPMFTVDELFSQWFILIPQTTYYEIPTQNSTVHYDANSSQCWAKEVYLIDLNGKRNLLWCNYNQAKLRILSYNDGRHFIK